MSDEILNPETLTAVETPVVADPAVSDTPPESATATTPAAPATPSPPSAPISDETAPAASGPQVVYVGPRLPAKPYPVAPKTIFRGDLPKPLAKAVKADADLAALFVPVAETGSALKAVAQQGSALCRAAAAVSDKYLTRKEG